MSGSPPRSSALWGLALVCAAALPARAQDAGAGVAEAFADGRYELALEAVDGLSDPVLAAEWRFQILHAAGDLSGALRAARAGLARDPGHLRLLQNAANCALTLGEGELAAGLCERWSAALESAALEPGARAAERERVARYSASARQLLDGDESARRAERRARWTTLGLLSTVVAALLYLARR